MKGKNWFILTTALVIVPLENKANILSSLIQETVDIFRNLYFAIWEFFDIQD